MLSSSPLLLPLFIFEGKSMERWGEKSKQKRKGERNKLSRGERDYSEKTEGLSIFSLLDVFVVMVTPCGNVM